MLSSQRSSAKTFSCIYASHCLSAWGDRLWDFAVGLYMIILYPDSLLLTAILGFSGCFSVITLGGLLGKWIDKTSRIKTAVSAIVVQNAAVALGASALALTFAFQDEIQQITWKGITLEMLIYAFIIAASVIAKLGSVASDIAIERDWVVVLTDGDSKRLATMNSVMRTIDLTTKILAPIAIGTLISYWSPMYGAIFIAGWNILSGFLEIYLLLLIHKDIPADLQKASSANTSFHSVKRNPFRECWESWRQYLSHPLKLAGIGFSCVYMTVLGFDPITIGYMYGQGMDGNLIGICTALGAITGILGSISYPSFRMRLGGNITTFVGYGTNSICLFLCVVSVFMKGSPFEPFGSNNPSSSSALPTNLQTLTIEELWNERPNIFCFVAGIILARFGLWMADLSIAQLFQDNVEESQRGVINGVQNAIQEGFDLFKFFLVILLPSPETFGYLIGATWISTLTAIGLHAIFSSTCQLRGGRDGNRSFYNDEEIHGRRHVDQESCSDLPRPDELTPLLM